MNATSAVEMPEKRTDGERSVWPLGSASGRVRLYLGDCMEILPSLTCIDAIITDPPYGQKLNTRNGTRGNKPPHSDRTIEAKDWPEIEGDDAPFDPTPWLRYPRVVLWGAQHYCDRLPPGTKWLVWDKREGVMQNDNSDCEMAWTNQRGVVRMHRQLWAGLLRRGEENGQATTHPTQKSIALMAWCMEQVGVPSGATVFDPYMGSGSAGIACVRTGRSYIGVEKVKQHFDMACERIGRELAQGDFFLPQNAGDVPRAGNGAAPKEKNNL